MPSTVIRHFHYDAGSKQLTIEFQSGRRYAYFDVPADVHAALKRASSRGSYFNTVVRDHYAFERLDEEDGGAGSR